MSRVLVLGIVAACVLGVFAGPGLAQASQGGSPRSQSAAAPERRPLFGDRSEPVTVDADHLEAYQKEGLVVFTGNVVARQANSVQYADRVEVYLDPDGNRITRTVSTGSVRIVTRDCRTGTAERGEYYDAEQRMILIGSARVWQDDNVVTGERITIYLAEERSVVEGGKQERVKAVFHPRRQEATTPAGRPEGSSCQ